MLALFPFYWMAITSIKPNAELYNRNVMPLIVHAPTLKHYVDLLTETSFLLWTWNTMLVAVVSTAISLVLGTMLAYPLARMRFAGVVADCDDDRGDLPRAAAAAVHAAGRRDQPARPRQYADLGDPDLPDDAGAVLRLAAARLFQDRAEGARGGGADRRRQPAADHVARSSCRCARPGFISAGIFAFTLSQNEFLYALIFLTKSSVRTVPVGVIAELIRGDVFYWGQLMAGALLGLDPGGDHLLVLRRALCRRPHRGFSQGMNRQI